MAWIFSHVISAEIVSKKNIYTWGYLEALSQSAYITIIVYDLFELAKGNPFEIALKFELEMFLYWRLDYL